MLRLHPIIAEKYYAKELALEIWQSLEQEYGKLGIAAIYQEFRGAMETIIPGNSDPSLALNNIITHFSRMAASQCAVPDHLQVMIIISKLPPIMGPLVQAVCQTDDINSLVLDKVRRAIVLGWEQRSSTQYNNPPHQPQAAIKLSTVQCSGPLPSFQQQQQQLQEENQNQAQGQGSNWGGWCGCRGRGGTYRGTCAGKNKQNQQQQQQAGRPIEEHAPSPALSFVFGKIASPLIVNPPTITNPADVPCSVSLNFTNTLSLAHHIGVKPTTKTVKRLEIGERAREEQRLSQPNKHPRIKRDDEVSLGWSLSGRTSVVT